jgi:uracil-DNA glycosylase family 4
MGRRDEVLREMGLWPVWRLRSRTAGLLAMVSADDSPTLDGVTGSAEVSSNQRAGQAPVRQAQGRLRPVVNAQDRPGSGQVSLGAGAGARTSPDAARRSQILSMDWEQLKTSVAVCVSCQLHAKRTQAVFGVGDPHADWLFVGEGPGAEEDRLGEPFVGQAGKLLDNMLRAIGLKRGHGVYIANAVKCRPPGNRNPEPGEIAECEPFLTRQIELIKPKLIVVLGKIAAQALLKTDASIASLRGRMHQYRGVPLIVTYHPAYLLRNLPDKAKAWADLCFARQTMRQLQSAVMVTPGPSPRSRERRLEPPLAASTGEGKEPAPDPIGGMGDLAPM